MKPEISGGRPNSLTRMEMMGSMKVTFIIAIIQAKNAIITLTSFSTVQYVIFFFIYRSYTVSTFPVEIRSAAGYSTHLTRAAKITKFAPYI